MKSADSNYPFDQEFLLERLGGSMELLRDIAVLFLTEYPRQLQEVQNAVEARNVKGLQTAAHKIKGTARDFAAGPATEAAAALEQTTDFGDGAAITEMLSRLSHELRRLQVALEEVLSSRG
jgi:HPt (histidine-containing phosphotransfer) domain-containing protein